MQSFGGFLPHFAARYSPSLLAIHLDTSLLDKTTGLGMRNLECLNCIAAIVLYLLCGQFIHNIKVGRSKKTYMLL